MKIGIEGQRLFRTKKHGMDMVALELIKELQLIDKENQYYIYISPDEDNKCLIETENFKIRLIEGGFYPKWEQISLPKAAKADHVDLLHCTSNTAPLSINIPLVLTLHDIIYMEKSYMQILKGSGTSYQKFGNLYRRFVVPKIIKNSKKIITVSEFEKRRIADFFKLDGKKLKAVYNGVSTHFKKITDNEELIRVKEKYKLPDKFFFFLGNTDPKKNTKGVLQALSLFYKGNTEGYKLVMLDYEKAELDKLIAEIGDPSLSDHIHLTGYVINTDLPAIYNLCSIFLYPSLRESFGIPMLEAMACGVPVITSNTSSMPEIADEAALIIDPFKPEDITDGIIKILSNEKFKSELIEKGFKQAARFTWKSMAEKVLNIYKEINSNK
jgi:glycosyltransferase involved in cell wall biosynthesis